MATFSWSSPSASRILFVFTFLCVFSMIHNSEAQVTIDPDEVALNTIFAKWGVSAHESWNISGKPCSDTAVNKDVLIDDQRYNPFIKCDCLDNNNGTLCRITAMKVYALNARGEIPEELQNLTQLTNLNLGQNYLTGPLPAFIGKLTKMKYLSLGINGLSGTIPKELGDLRNLIVLSFSSNNFSGSLPPQLGNLTMLQQLYIDSAGVGGEIPSTFAKLKQMKILWASDNNFTGKLPDFIGSWSNMTDLRFQGNAFQGPIPSSFSRLTSLTSLRIGELSNTSSSLEFISSMTSIGILILRNCMITGSLPSYLGNFPSLLHLDLSFNNITGSLPQSLFASNSLQYLFLGSNNLSGALPSGKSTQLNFIDLTSNFFSGSIPSWAKDTNTDLQLNLVANNFSEDDLKSSSNYTGLICIQRNFPCYRGSPKYPSFAINSGGGATKSSDNKIFEADDKQLGAASFYITSNNRWAVSSIGRFVDSKNAQYIQESPSQISNLLDTELLKNVRLSPGSIKYYGLGLENGNYTVTLQFAELDNPVEGTWQSVQRRVFDIYIQGVLKEKEFDIKKAAGGLSLRGVRKDYKQIQVTENMMEIHFFWAGKGTCCIPRQGQYGPSISAVNAVPEFIPTVRDDISNPKSKRRNLSVIVGIPVVLGLIILLAICVALILKRRMSSYTDEELEGISTRANTFSYSELKTATDGFAKENKLGEGGFGPVYKGILSDGRPVAVKQLSLRSHQGKRQFVTEIDTISAVQHRNLVKLYGCCIQGTQRMLVYEYMENNSLHQALFGEKGLDLDWKTRFEICVGTARGLAYLHEDSRPKIVHRDVKASNILLDTELNPKISDFGLAKLYDDKMTHISTRVAGTVGYLAPEYAMKGHLSEKADVFAFGVVLLEILSGRPNYAPNSSREQIYLLEWAWFLHENGRQLELIDPKLRDYNEEEILRVLTVGLLCTQLSPFIRPSMSRVVFMLIGDAELTDVPAKPGYLNDLNMDGDLESISISSFSGFR